MELTKREIAIDKKIYLIVIMFGLLISYYVFKEFSFIKLILSGGHIEFWYIDTVLYFMTLFILPLGTFLFWKRDKIGWILMTIFFSYSIINAIGMFFRVWEFGSNTEAEEFIEVTNSSPEEAPIVYLFVIAISSVLLWIINKSDLKNIFHVNKQSTLITIGVSILITVILGAI